MTTPACLTWDITAEDLARAADCPEHFAHVLLWNWQRGQCACCGEWSSQLVRLVRDHDHATGLLRGLLCKPCNTFEGYSLTAMDPSFSPDHGRLDGRRRSFDKWRASEENLLRVKLVDRYRASNPCSLLGLSARHSATSAPAGQALPSVYERDLPIVDVDRALWIQFRRATRTVAMPDDRSAALRDFMEWMVRKPGVKMPQRPPISS